MIEKVNPMHPDKIADRIAGAMVDYAYRMEENPRIAIEVLIGHGECYIIAETSVHFSLPWISETVKRISKTNVAVSYKEVPQDVHLSENQSKGMRCGDNGIFKGVPLSKEEMELTGIARRIYNKFKCDGKYILADDILTVCQSNAERSGIIKMIPRWYRAESVINPLGYWTGGVNVDSGATNRKLGSDMARSVTGGGLHGKDLSKADVSANIYAFLKAQKTEEEVELHCSIGDESIDGIPYTEIVEVARKFVDDLGGFEKLAEWGLF